MTRRRAGASLLGALLLCAAAAPPPGTALAGKVVVLPVSDEEQFMVDEGLSIFLERRIREAEEGGARALVLEIDTYGGAVHAALKISDLLLNTSIPQTVAFVKTKAISAGALITLSCQEIVMNPNTAIGDCEPILQTGQGIEYGQEKFKTALRARFRLFSERHGYPAAIGEGMVDKEITVYRAVAGGETRFLTDTDLKNLKQQGEAPADLSVVKPKGQLLTLTANEAVAYGVASRLAADRAAVLALYGWSPGDVVVVEPTWSETLTRLVTSPLVAGILLLLGLIAAYVAMNHPGLGVPELIALLCFGALFGGKYMAGLAESWEIALFALGVMLLLVEIFVLPGFGLAGFVGLALMLVALFLAFLPAVPDAPPAAPPAEDPLYVPPPAPDWGALFRRAAWAIFGGFGGALLAILALVKWMGDIPLMRRMVLSAVTGAADVVAVGASGAPTETLAQWLGRRGTAVTTLRPAGRIEIDGTHLEAATEGEYLDRGTPVVVARVEGARLYVKRAT